MAGTPAFVETVWLVHQAKGCNQRLAEVMLLPDGSVAPYDRNAVDAQRVEEVKRGIPLPLPHRRWELGLTAKRARTAAEARLVPGLKGPRPQSLTMRNGKPFCGHCQTALGIKPAKLASRVSNAIRSGASTVGIC